MLTSRNPFVRIVSYQNIGQCHLDRVQIQLTRSKSGSSFLIHRIHQCLNSCIGEIPMTLQFHFGVMILRGFLQNGIGNFKGERLNTLLAADP